MVVLVWTKHQDLASHIANLLESRSVGGTQLLTPIGGNEAVALSYPFQFVLQNRWGWACCNVAKCRGYAGRFVAV